MHLKLRILQHGDVAHLTTPETITLNGDEYKLHGFFRYAPKHIINDYIKGVEYYHPDADEILLIPIDNITYGTGRYHSRIAVYVKDCI